MAGPINPADPIEPGRAERLVVPMALVWKGDIPLVTFGEIAPQDLDEPFLDDALAKARILGFRPLDALAEERSAPPIGGMIFHMTRCGSTLLCRQFSAVARIAVLSEPFAFQHLIEGPAASPHVTRRRIRQLAAAWCDGLAPIADRIVIKWPLLVGHHAAAIVEALDTVPALFLYRDPVEILASIEAESLGGLQYIRPAHLFGSGDGEMPAVPRDALDICALAIARACQIASQVSGLQTLDYRALPDAAWRLVAPYFGVSLAGSDVDAMRRASGIHSKDRGKRQTFTDDGVAKHSAAGAHAKRLAEELLSPMLRELLRSQVPLGPVDAAQRLQ